MKPSNVHTHIFCLDDVPNDFLELYLSNRLASTLLDRLIRTKAGMLLAAGIKKLSGKTSMIRRFIAISEAGRFADASHLYELLQQQYDNLPFRFVALTLNLDHIGGGDSKLYNSQLENVIATKKKQADPSSLILFLSLDPRSYNSGPAMLQDVKCRFETPIPGTAVYPFSGLKIYPSTGYFVFDDKLKPTFEWAADNGIPVMSHNYYLGGVFLNNRSSIEANFANAFDVYANTSYAGAAWQEAGGGFFAKLWGSDRTESNQQSSSYFMEPESYRTMLQYFKDRGGPQLKLCFAHFGGLSQMRLHNNPASISDPLQTNPIGVKRTNWHTQIISLMNEYEGVYTDISYMTAEFDYAKEKFYELLYGYMDNPSLQKRILYGTDFYLAEKSSLGEQSVFHLFKTAASNRVLTNGNTMWQQLADVNPLQYLSNRYFVP